MSMLRLDVYTRAMTPNEKILNRVVAGPEGCWPYVGPLNKDGYGERVMHAGVRKFPHVWTWEAAQGRERFPGMQLDHLCRNRRCVNPAHLEEVTAAENQRRGEGVAGRNHRKTECAQGHLLSGDNLYVCPRGRRECKTCRAAATARYLSNRAR